MTSDHSGRPKRSGAASSGLRRRSYEQTNNEDVVVNLDRNGFHEIPALEYGESRTENLLLQGENLAVLEALTPKLRGSVRCAYIDPPYNNNERYAHYDDALSHDAWLSEIEPRIRLLYDLLREDGSLWISIDDNQVHYLKVLADRLFGREAFVATIVWQHRTTRENRRAFSNNHEYLLVYARNAARFRETRNLMPVDWTATGRYKNPDNDPCGLWQSVSANVQDGHATPSQFYEVIAPNGRRHSPPKGRCWALPKDRMERAIAEGRVWFGRDGNGVPRIKRYLSDAQPGLTPETLWPAETAGTTRAAKRQLLEMFPSETLFDTPKPEQLVKRILEIATDPGDLVVDAYLGSGTTAAVAHKMNRRYIGIEIGDHALTHCAQRLRKVVDGEQSGISELVGWKGGGGFRFFRSEEAQQSAA
jgi:adenine-specific DNA-methyltransferase